MGPIAKSGFAECVIPPVVRLAGKRLHMVTLGHALLLERIGSPFAVTSPPDRLPEAGDNALAWWILTRPWDEAANGIGGRLSRFWTWCFTLARARVAAEDSVSILRWVKWSTTSPGFEPIRDADEEGEPLGAHPVLIRAQAAASKWGVPYPAVLNLPWNVCCWLYLTRWEEAGAVRIVDLQELEAAFAEMRDPKRKAQLEDLARRVEERHRSENPK